MFARATLFVAVALALNSPADARVYQADLDGAQVLPFQIPTPATGHAVVDTRGSLAFALDVEVTFSNLMASNTGASLHCCITPEERRSTVAINFLGDWPSGAKSASFFQTYVLTDAATYSSTFFFNHGGTAASARQALVEGLYAGRAYVSIRSSLWPGGEVRGDLRLTPSADFDDDSDVDGADFLIWQRHAGGLGTHELGDATGDGDIDQNDLFIWSIEFGDVVNATSLAIPEPAAPWFAAGAFVVVIAFGVCRRGRSNGRPNDAAIPLTLAADAAGAAGTLPRLRAIVLR